ncbi:MAG: phosphate/phosphite/phosphonate ABC transporter substrate-binding protein [Pseudomonadota bacterium]|nr:phosphate/phosphite/phosphonate ABC transporter substrate-binding protein [Pseudomonadota bacterium]
MSRILHLLLACVFLIGASTATAEDDTLVLGQISDNPKEHYARLKPLLDYVVARMGDVGIKHGRILMARDPEQMTSYLRRGRVDWVSETVGAGMMFQANARAEPILLTRRHGQASYATVIFVHKDSPIQHIEDLRGRGIALQNPWSTTSGLLPRGDILRAGIGMELLVLPYEQPAPRNIGYVFARSERNIAAWVVRGVVSAGAMADSDLDMVERVPPSYREQIRVIHQGRSVPRGMELAGAHMPANVRKRLREVLLAANTDPAATAALDAFFRTSEFTAIDAEARAALAEVSASVKSVQENSR